MKKTRAIGVERRLGRAGSALVATAPLVRVKPGAETLFSRDSLGDAILERVTAALGSNVTAEILGVDPAQTSRWRHHKEQISPNIYGRLLDLHDLLNRVLQIYHPDDAGEWLSTPSPWLRGSRPIDVLGHYGFAPVIEALDAIEQGAYL